MCLGSVYFCVDYGMKGSSKEEDVPCNTLGELMIYATWVA